MLIAGWCVQSNGQALGRISKARRMISVIGASAAGSGVAVIGKVGISNRS